MAHTKTLAEIPILKADLFTVNELHLLFPDGKERFYKSVRRNTAVSVFPLTEKNEIYLIKQYRHLLNRDAIESVAGFVDEGEDPLTAAKRELKEEAGLEAKEWRLLTTVNAAGSVVTWQQPLFVVRGLTQGEDAQEETEDITVLKMTIDEAVAKVMQGEISTASSMIGILMIKQLIQEGKL